eukprot:g284.t1
MADEPQVEEELAEEPVEPEDPEVKTLAENLGNLVIGRIVAGGIPSELGGNKLDKKNGTALLFSHENDGMPVVKLNSRVHGWFVETISSLG